MSKGLKRLLLIGTAIGAAVVGISYFMNKKLSDEDFDDFDDDDDVFDEDEFDEDLDNDISERSYVPLTPQPAKETLEDINIPTASTETIEEFFDEDEN